MLLSFPSCLSSDFCDKFVLGGWKREMFDREAGNIYRIYWTTKLCLQYTNSAGKSEKLFLPYLEVCIYIFTPHLPNSIPTSQSNKAKIFTVTLEEKSENEMK